MVYPLVSQIGINYRRSSLSDHRGDARFQIKAGDRMPYFLSDGKSVYDLLRQPKFHFLVFSNEGKDFNELFAQVGKDGEWVDCQTIPLAPRVAEIFDFHESFALLLRPDNHVAFISESLSTDEVNNYQRSVAKINRRSR